MPHFGPISRRDLIAALRRAGFEGTYQGGDHQYMMRDNWKSRVIIPNPHRGDISTGLLKKVLRQAELSREEWEKL
jgi:predicted RNA binding protein YcfA (HicA-like mRNA interferase family)